MTTVLSELSWSYYLVSIDVYYSAGKNRDDIFVADYKVKLPKETEIKEAFEKTT
ncbi:MAG: hypothetical protein GQ477_02610 [Nanohaloarchaea archaeon]|nr:hypothetical protein [Candidatus Nanohaloarchaea archaeon]